MKLHFKVNKNILTRKDDEIVTSYFKNNIKCIFNCNCLSDIYKHALFINTSGSQYIEDLGYGKCVSCTVPEEVLNGAYFLVSIFGDDLITTTQETILIQPSGFNKKTEQAMENGNAEVVQSSVSDIEINRIHNNCRCRGYGHYTWEHPYI